MRKIFLWFSLLSLSIFLSSCGIIGSKTNYSLSIQVSPPEGGSVSPTGGQYEDGSSVNIVATANEGWRFSNWSKDFSGTEKSAHIRINEDKNIEAVFERKEYYLDLNQNGQGTVKEVVVQSKSKKHPYQTEVKLTAIPDEDWEFVRWKGDLNGMTNTDTLTIDEVKTVTAHFGSREVVPYNYLESNLYPTSVSAANTIATAKGSLRNDLFDVITIKSIIVVNEKKEIVSKWSGDEIITISPGHITSFDIFVYSDSPTRNEFEKYTIYWELDYRGSTYNKIGDACSNCS